MPVGATEAIFVIARTAGWIAHALEEYGESPLRFRARAVYNGPEEGIGHTLPERYARPILASGPADFWRRWNTYMGQWLMRYVFSPLSLRLGASVRSRRARAATAGVGVLAAFGACGLMHDVSAYATSFVVETRMFEMFLANGALVVASAAPRSLNWRMAPATASWAAATASVATRATLWAAVAGSFYLWLR
jgi:citrate synthase